VHRTMPQARACAWAEEQIEKGGSIRSPHVRGGALVALVVVALGLPAVGATAPPASVRTVAEERCVATTGTRLLALGTLALAMDRVVAVTQATGPGRAGSAVEARGGVRYDEQASFCECSRRPAGRSAALLGASPQRVRGRRNVAWLACVYVQVSFQLDCRAPGAREPGAQAGIVRRAVQWHPDSRAQLPVYRRENLYVR
jgi:hypothetical protein